MDNQKLGEIVTRLSYINYKSDKMRKIQKITGHWESNPRPSGLRIDVITSAPNQKPFCVFKEHNM